MPLSYQIINKGASNETMNKYFSSDTSSSKLMNNDGLIQNITMSNIVSCLKQLSDLSLLSNQIFNNLLIDTSKINERCKKLSNRTKSLYNDISLVKDIQKNNSSIISSQLDIDVYNNYRQMLQNPQSQQLIDRKSMPIQIQLRYQSNKLNHLIDFSKIDLDKNNLKDGEKIKTIAHKYSNPNFFLHQWVLVQEARMKQLDNERKQNKQDKKQRKEQQLAGSSTTEVKEKKRKSSVNWQDRYMVDGKAVHRASTVLDKRKSGWGNINLAAAATATKDDGGESNAMATEEQEDVTNTDKKIDETAEKVDSLNIQQTNINKENNVVDDEDDEEPPQSPPSMKPFSSFKSTIISPSSQKALSNESDEVNVSPIAPVTNNTISPPPPPPPSSRLSISPVLATTTDESAAAIVSISSTQENDEEEEDDDDDDVEHSHVRAIQKINIMPTPQKKTHYLDTSEDLISSPLIAPVLVSRPPPPPPPPPMKQTSLLLKSKEPDSSSSSSIKQQEPFSMPSNTARSNLFAAIKSGGNDLRKVSTEDSNTGKETIKTIAPSGGRESLFDAIKNRSSVLRKVTTEELQQADDEKKRRNSTLGGFGSSSVSAILERRKFLEAESSSDDDSDNDVDAWN